MTSIAATVGTAVCVRGTGQIPDHGAKQVEAR
jgi:hypothetical protein